MNNHWEPTPYRVTFADGVHVDYLAPTAWEAYTNAKQYHEGEVVSITIATWDASWNERDERAIKLASGEP